MSLLDEVLLQLTVLDRAPRYDGWGVALSVVGLGVTVKMCKSQTVGRMCLSAAVAPQPRAHRAARVAHRALRPRLAIASVLPSRPVPRC